MNPGGDSSEYVFGAGIFEAIQGWWSTNITKLVERWTTGSMANNGLIIIPTPGVEDYVKVFQSSDQTGNPTLVPRLVVQYTLQGDVGAYESAPLGPGTDAEFTLSTWSNSTVSFVSDEFSGAGLSPKWTWLNNPMSVGGTYNVGLTFPGELYIEGGTYTSNSPGDIGSNYLYQEIVKDFRVTTRVIDSFSEDQMGAGIMLMENDTGWVAIEKTGPSGSATVRVLICENGLLEEMANVDWSGSSSAYLRIVRDGHELTFYVSSDGSAFTPLYTYAPDNGLMLTVKAGLYVYSDSAQRPVVHFDFFRAVPLITDPIDVRVRLGESLDLMDPSWGDWSDALPGAGSYVVGEVAKYLQYRVYMSTDAEWYSPALHQFRCHYEYYPETGTVTTPDFMPGDFSAWISISSPEDVTDGIVRYWYSFDSGSSWHYAGTGGVYSVASTSPMIRLRAEIETYDSLSTPQIDFMAATYGKALSSFYIEAPYQVVAGDAFEMVVYAKDSANLTLWPWSGLVQLTAMDQSGTVLASDYLGMTTAVIAANGYVTIPEQSYDTAETITIRASAPGISGLSHAIQIIPGPVASVTISPDVDEVAEHTTQSFTATAWDALGNDITGASFSWTVDSALGSLSSSTGTTVVLTASESGGSGDLAVTSDGVTETRTIYVVRSLNAPDIHTPIPTQVKEEDSSTWTVDLSEHVTDEYFTMQDLRWYVTGEKLVKATGENRTGNMVMSLTPNQDMWGENELMLVVVDPDGLWSSVEFDVVINPVNDAPVIDEFIAPLVVHFDIVYMYNMRYHVEDVDNTLDELNMTVDEVSAQYVEVERLTLALNYPESLNGTFQSLHVTVSDGELSSSTTIIVEVSDDGVPLISDNLPSIEMFQGESLIHVFDLDDFFADPDHDMLFYTSGEEHVTVEICPDNRVSFYAGYEWAGIEYVIFNALDPRGARVESPCEVTVYQVNQPPSIEGVPDLMVKYEQAYEFDLSRYIHDTDDALDSLNVQTDSPYIAVAGVVLSMNYPASTSGRSFDVTITVSDEEFSDSCTIQVTVGDNSPPTPLALPSHSFHEDVEAPYPLDKKSLTAYFEDDDDVSNLTFEVYPWIPQIEGELDGSKSAGWWINFTTEDNYNGITAFTVRAIDSGGAIAEATVGLTVMPVPDAPVISINGSVTTEVGYRMPVDISQYVGDVDTPMNSLWYSVTGTGSEYVTAMVGMLVLDFPEEFVEVPGESKWVNITIIVMDSDGLTDSDILTIEVHRSVATGEADTWTYWAMLLLGGTAFGLFLVATSRRKKPFVIRDMMLIHNDGFLIGRAAERHEGEIDEDILSGMLTAVLNFVEDSMSTNEDSLKTFGFKEYKVMVHRATLTYAAVVYEGDPLEDIEKKLGEFLEKTERIYRKRIENWTGDMSVDFAGVEVLLEAFVKDNSKKHFFPSNGADREEMPEGEPVVEVVQEPPPPESEDAARKTRKLRSR